MKSRLLLYFVLLPGAAILPAAMIWFPDSFTRGYRLVLDHPIWVLAVAILLFFNVGYDVLLHTSGKIRRKLVAVLVLVAGAFFAYTISTFDSMTIIEATVYSVIAIYLISALINKQNEKSQDT